MLEVLEFVFASFWRFAGSIILLAALGGTLSQFRLVSIHTDNRATYTGESGE